MDDIRKPSSSKRYLIRPQTDNSPAFWLEVSVLEQASGDRVNRLIRLRDVTDEKKELCRIHSFESAISYKFRTRLAGMVSIINTLDRPDAENLRIRIINNGISLSPDQLSRVWSPYYQGGSFLYEKSEGLGLGLPTIASYVWHWGGKCRLYNREDRPGVVVELVLPVKMGNG